MTLEAEELQKAPFPELYLLPDQKLGDRCRLRGKDEVVNPVAELHLMIGLASHRPKAAGRRPHPNHPTASGVLQRLVRHRLVPR